MLRILRILRVSRLSRELRVLRMASWPARDESNDYSQNSKWISMNWIGGPLMFTKPSVSDLGSQILVFQLFLGVRSTQVCAISIVDGVLFYPAFFAKVFFYLFENGLKFD